jgi:hypothetical protein
MYNHNILALGGGGGRKKYKSKKFSITFPKHKSIKTFKESPT